MNTLLRNPVFERLRQSGYCIKPGYLARQEPSYFDDILTATDAIVHQPDVYRFAGYLARRFGCRNIIDLGCGSGNKLAELATEFHIIGVDFGANVSRFREAHPQALAIEHNFAEQVLRIEDRELLRNSLIVCSDIIEHLVDPVPLLATLRDLMTDAPVGIVTTPERDLVRGIEDPGPPGNVHHIREWSLSELERLARGAGLNVEFAGLTVNNNRDWAKRTSLLILRQLGNEQWVSAPPDFRVAAFMCVYNEEDVIEEVLRHLTAQGVEVHLVDNWSTDGTVERAKAFLGRGVSEITKYPADGPSGTYDWHALLTHVEQLSHASNADWCIHYDADEIRESPWPQVSLRDALYRVDREGFNAVDHTCVVFHPTHQGNEDPASLTSYRSFDFGKRPGHFVQIKAWKRQSMPVRLAESGGHQAEFPGRKVYPYKFLLRHYPVRSQEHGIRKIVADRQQRWNVTERQTRGWHVQYDHVMANHNFLRNAGDLPSFSPGTFYRDYLVERLSGIGAERS